MAMASTPSPSRDINPWLVAVAVMSSTFMEVLDTTVVNVSLPHIAGDLSASTDEATWTLTSYLVANAIILPMTGWLASTFGRKRLLTASVIGFTTASFFCGLAPSLPFLIIFRIIQGACGGGLQPLSQAILLEAFPPEKRGQAMAFWALGIVVAPMLGPVAGGWLTDNYSWRWVFYINIPIGILAIMLTQLFVFDPSYLRKKSSGIDYWGIGLLVLGIGLSLGGPTGYAINPARDLGPRIMHALLPIPGKRDSDWGYAWVPVVGPVLGALLAAMVFKVL